MTNRDVVLLNNYIYSTILSFNNMNSSGSRNNRKYIRVLPDKKYPVRVDMNGENFLDIFTASDISMGGIGVLVPHKFKDCKIYMDVEVIVSLPHPVEKNISFKARVEHISSFTFGISFARLDDKEVESVKKYIANRLFKTSRLDWLKFKFGLI